MAHTDRTTMSDETSDHVLLPVITSAKMVAQKRHNIGYPFGIALCMWN